MTTKLTDAEIDALSGKVIAVVELGGRQLPKYCECGGEMDYSFGFGRVFSVCKKCTPVEVVRLPLANRKGE